VLQLRCPRSSSILIVRRKAAKERAGEKPV